MILDGEFYTYKQKDSGYSQDLKDCIEQTCKYCLKNTNANPEEKINHPIMMLGKIQSGKTRAFTGLIALSFDNHFDMIFILTKNSKALVQQTVKRMKDEFKPFVKGNKLSVTDVIKIQNQMSGYQLDQKNIVVAKKETKNLENILNFIAKYSITEKKKCLIIDDEADTTSVGYDKVQNSDDDFNLRVVSSKINTMRGTLDGCVFVQVTATPYALYLQPNDMGGAADIYPVKPLQTVLVPHGREYVGGEYYFIESKRDDSPAQYLFTAMSDEEGELVSNQKRKGKKSKIEDRRSFKIEEILTNSERLAAFKRGIFNFIIGTIILRQELTNNHYAYIIHTATQKNSHEKLSTILEELMKQISEGKHKREVTKLIKQSYTDLQQSVEAYGKTMPSYDFVKDEFYAYIQKGYYSIDIVNADKAIEGLLDEDSGELNLRTPCSIFIGGQVLDRGVTIPHMIGFYYARNPFTMQQDTVLQHSRMFGYRKALLPVTRFYTTARIHSNMVHITEIDEMLREDIKLGKQGNGIYFITRRAQDSSFGRGKISPCSPAKIKLSDIVLLKPHRRVLPVGFSPSNKSTYNKASKEIKQIIQAAKHEKDNIYSLTLENAEKLIKAVYTSIIADEDFLDCEQFLTILAYFSESETSHVYVTLDEDMNVTKYKKDGISLQDSPDTAQSHLKKARKLAESVPCIMLFQENGDDESWGHKSFWWPVLVAPSKVNNTIYAQKEAAGSVSVFPKGS